MTIGDIVRCFGNTEDGRHVANLTGTVVSTFGNRIGVSWDGYTNGHDCNTRCKHPTGWYVNADDLEVIGPITPEDDELYDCHLEDMV